jgi:acyl dehydratase
VTDYIAYWAGNEGFIRYSTTSYRGPAYEGDVTYLEAEVAEKQEESAWGAPLVRLEVKLRDQEHKVLATGKVDVELPR